MRRGRSGSIESRHLRTLFEVGAAGTLSDGQLLERFAAGRDEGAELAFAALVERHGPMVLRVARSTLGDDHSARDAFQATFLILARKGPTLWVRDSIGPWLGAVARRVAARARADRGRRGRLERAAARAEATPGPESAPDDLALAIAEEIARLPEGYRSAVVLCHLEGLTQHEAARRLGCPLGTLQSRLDRGRRRLRDRLGRRGFAPGLVLLPPAGPAPLPDALVRAASRAAVAPGSAPWVGPAALALAEATSKGLLMAPWKLAALALTLALGLAGSGAYVGTHRTARATEGPPLAAPPAPIPAPAPAAPTVVLEERPDGQVVTRLLAPQPGGKPDAIAPKADADADDPPLPPPVEGPGFPLLLEFRADWSPPSVAMRPAIDRLIRGGYPVKSVDIDRSRAMVDRFGVGAIPTFLVVDAAGAEVARSQGQLPALDLARFYNENRDKSGQETRAAAEPLEPSLTEALVPRPWETPVRIKLQITEKEWGFASGTIIRSDARESIILTCAHTYRVRGGTQPSPKQFRIPIRVDLFDGILGGPRRSMVGKAELDLAGELIDLDFNNDVALLRIRPGRVLPASPVVPTYWVPKAGMKMIALGCSHANDATAWSTSILDPKVRMQNSATGQPFLMIKCAQQPMEGRSGGGLFTKDGYVAGVCAFADPSEKVGLYATPEAIHRLLDRNGLGEAQQPSTTEGHRPGDGNDRDPSDRPKSNPPGATDTDRRLADLERKLDRLLGSQEAGREPEGPIGDFDPIVAPKRLIQGGRPR